MPHINSEPSGDSKGGDSRSASRFLGTLPLLGEAIDLAAEVADKLTEISEADLVEELVQALGRDKPVLSAMLRSLLPDREFKIIQDLLGRAAETLTPAEQLRKLAGPVSEIPRKGISWAGGWKRDARLPDAGSLTTTLKGSSRANIRILPGPTYELKGALGVAGGFKAPLSFGQVSMSGPAIGPETSAHEIRAPRRTQRSRSA